MTFYDVHHIGSPSKEQNKEYNDYKEQKKRKIKVKAHVIIRYEDRVLLYPAFTAPDVHRCVGGTVEFGERAADAAVREVKEETGLDIVDLEELAVFENIFERNGKPKHEIVFLFSAGLLDESKNLADIDVVEGEDRAKAVWVPTHQLRDGEIAVAPEKVLEYL